MLTLSKTIDSSRTQPIVLPFVEGQYWIINLENISDVEVERASSILQKEDRERAIQFHFKKEQDRCMIIYALLKLILGSILNLPGQKISFQRNRFGKPYLQENPLYFNLSHTEKKALIGIHPLRSIGVDLEELNPNFEEDSFLFPSEKEWLYHFKDRSEGIITLWCAKEAILKAKGIGFLANQLPCFESLERGQNGMDVFRLCDQAVFVYQEILEGYKIAISIL